MDEERTEYVSLMVDKNTKSKIDNCKNDNQMMEKIIIDYVEKEKSALADSLRDFSESELLYKYELVKLKNSYEKAQEEYCEAVSNLYDKVGLKNRLLKDELNKPLELIKSISNTIRGLKEAVDNIPNMYQLQNLKDLINTIKEFNKLSSSEQNLIKLMLESKNTDN